MSMEALRVVYRLRGVGAEATRRAEALALEQSVEMPIEAVTDGRVLREVVARVESLEAQADGTSLARLALSAESIGGDAGQLMNMLFGNSSLLDDVRVVDVEVPATLSRRFGGPHQGIDGIRRLTGVSGRALSCTALKPIGSTVEDLARMTRVFCEAGAGCHQGRPRLGRRRARLVQGTRCRVSTGDRNGRPWPVDADAVRAGDLRQPRRDARPDPLRAGARRRHRYWWRR